MGSTSCDVEDDDDDDDYDSKTIFILNFEK